MRAAHFDCFSGISGDMVLGAVIDAGVSADAIRAALDSLGLPITLEVERVKRNGFAATKVNVIAPDQEDYRWGKLHRIVFDHAFEDAFDIPPQAGFTDLAPGLRGLARDGGYEVVNASGFGARSIGLNDFMFGGGPVRRYVGQPLFGAIVGVNAVPGGPSGIPGDPGYATQLATWLTADYHVVNMTSFVPGEQEEFVPAP